MSLFHCKTKVHDGGHEYDGGFMLVTKDGETLPPNINEILTAWEFGLTVKDIEDNGGEVWSDTRVVRCWVDQVIPDEDYDIARKYINGVNLYYVLGDVEFGDERDEEVA